MTTNSQLHTRRLAATPRGVGVMCDFFAQRAENASLGDVEGRATSTSRLASRC
jgi:4-aminobutyrate aminotransferase